MHLDARLPEARAQLGYVLLFKRQHDAAMAEFERAIALNPNFIDYRYARALLFAGEPARAIEVPEANMCLDPFQPLMYSTRWMGQANYMLKRYGDAVRLLREFTPRRPDIQLPHLWLAAAYAQLGQLEQASKEAMEVLRINPGFTIEGWKRLAVFKDPRMSTIILMGCARRDCRRLERRRPRPSWFAGRSMKNLFSAAAFVATLAVIEAASAQPFPSRPITIIVLFAAGGGTDVTARIVGEHMSRTLGQRIVIENTAGAGGTTELHLGDACQPRWIHDRNGHMGTHSTGGRALTNPRLSAGYRFRADRLDPLCQS